jgi:hypothetical protein
VEFFGNGVQVTTSHGPTKTVLGHLATVYPDRVRVELLPDGADENGELTGEMADLVREIYLRGGLELFPRGIDFVKRAGERPVARALARLQAQRGERLTNLLHGTIQVTPVLRTSLGLLDGTRTAQQAAAEMGMNEGQISALIRVLEASALLVG